MKKIERRKKAIKIFLTRWLVITFMGLLVVTGIFQFDKYQATKVIAPLLDLAFISNDISYYKELEATNRGYTDTTKYSIEIEKLTQERRDNYYNSSDKAISFVTRQHAIIKVLFGFIAVILVVIVTFFPLLVLWSFYDDAFRRLMNSWKRINEDAKKFSMYESYRKFSNSIKSIQ